MLRRPHLYTKPPGADDDVYPARPLLERHNVPQGAINKSSAIAVVDDPEPPDAEIIEGALAEIGPFIMTYNGLVVPAILPPLADLLDHLSIIIGAGERYSNATKWALTDSLAILEQVEADAERMKSQQYQDIMSMLESRYSAQYIANTRSIGRVWPIELRVPNAPYSLHKELAPAMRIALRQLAKARTMPRGDRRANMELAAQATIDITRQWLRDYANPDFDLSRDEFSSMYRAHPLPPSMWDEYIASEPSSLTPLIVKPSHGPRRPAFTYATVRPLLVRLATAHKRGEELSGDLIEAICEVFGIDMSRL